MKKRYGVAAAICLAGALVCVGFGIAKFRNATEENKDLESMRDSIKVFETLPPETLPPETTASETETAETTASETETPETTAPETMPPETAWVSPTGGNLSLDFDALRQVNPDVHAWIEIAGTKVDYPVLQSPTDDEKYLTTAFDGSYYVGGSLFTQATYNHTDFNDPVTVIYGHTMRSGTLFGQLQSVYTNATTFSEHEDIVIYLPGEVRHYTVFAAVPFENFHIMHVYDFTSEYWYESFFKRVSEIRAFNACINSEITPKYGDRVLILSTCLNEDSTKRFLVMAVYRDDLATHTAE